MTAVLDFPSNAETINWTDAPVPLGESLPSVPQFDMRILPKKLGRYAVDVAERMGCPIDFPAVAAIVALGSAIGARVCLKPYSKGTWYVPANVWAVIISPPSAIKSPPVLEMLRPLKEMDKHAADEYAKHIRNYEILKKAYDAEVTKLAKTDKAAAVAVVPPEEPKMTRYLVNDSTYEMLVAIAAANPDGFMVWRDELIGWFNSLNKENQKEARGLYLSGWNGNDGYATDRIGRGHVRADRICLSLIGTIQPSVLRQIVQDAVSGGVGDDGLVARFQLAIYPDPITKWHKVDRHPDLEAMNYYEDLVKRLTALDPKSVGAEVNMDGTAYLSFDDEAQAIFDHWRDKLEARFRTTDSDEHPAMLAHLGKYRSLVPKLALIFHLTANGIGDVDKKAVVRAIAMTQYLEAHARRMYHTATNRAQQSAIALSNKIKAGKLRDGFTRSEVLVKEWSGLRSADEVNIAVNVLSDMRWIKPCEDRSTGGRPSTNYYINPKVSRAA